MYAQAYASEIRPPYAATIGFYPSDERLLRKVIEDCFLDERFGPGRLPERGSRPGRILGGVVPHAGYSYSGPCAAHFYLELAEVKPRVETVVILGTNHTGFGGLYTTTLRFKRWATPLGLVEVDVEFIAEMLKLDEHDLVVDDPWAHWEEHSVEVQLPFLQYVYGDSFMLVPVVVKSVPQNDAATARMFAKLLARVADELGRDIVVLASSDFTHHGPYYGYVVFRENVAENVRKLDEMLIEHILRFDTEGFLKAINETGATVCGYSAIAATMEYARLRGAERAAKLCYYNSGEVTGDENAVVGYASIAFY